jgi:hypothetical protein
VVSCATDLEIMRILDILLAATILFVAWLVFTNRSSEKVLTAAGSAALFILVYITFSGTQIPATDTYPAVAFYRNSDKSILMPEGGWVFADSELNQLRHSNPELLSSAADKDGRTLYHHFLQREIIECLSRTYRGSWRVETHQFELFGDEEGFGGPSSPAVKSNVIDTAALSKIMHANWFADSVPTQPQLAVPPSTSLTVEAPSIDKSGIETGTIRLKNSLLTITIQTREGSWGTGPVGELMLFQWPPDFVHSHYVVNTRIEFSSWYPGDPMMSSYKDWAAQLVEVVKRNFDGRILWAKRMRLRDLVNEVHKTNPPPTTR